MRTNYTHTKALEIRRKLEKRVDDFPLNACDIATEALYNEFYCLIVFGAYLGKLDDSYLKKRKLSEEIKKEGIPHKMGFDPDSNQFIDITGDQFSISNPPVQLFSQKDPRLAFSQGEVNPGSIFSVDEVYLLNAKSVKLNPLYYKRLLPKRFLVARGIKA